MFNFNVVLISPCRVRWPGHAVAPHGRCARQVTPQQPVRKSRQSRRTMLRWLAAPLFDPDKGRGRDARLEAGDGYPKTLPDQWDQAIPHFILVLDVARQIPCQE